MLRDATHQQIPPSFKARGRITQEREKKDDWSLGVHHGDNLCSCMCCWCGMLKMGLVGCTALSPGPSLCNTAGFLPAKRAPSYGQSNIEEKERIFLPGAATSPTFFIMAISKCILSYWHCTPTLAQMPHADGNCKLDSLNLLSEKVSLKGEKKRPVASSLIFSWKNASG